MPTQARRRPQMPLPKGKKQKTTTKPDSIMNHFRAFYKSQWENERNRAANQVLSKEPSAF